MNESTKSVWVAEVQGSKGILPCGVLIPGTHAAELLGRMPIPHQVVLLWSHTMEGSDQRAVVAIPDLHSANDSELLIIFTADQKWVARWRSPNEAFVIGKPSE